MSTDTLPSDPKLLMRSIIQRIATGPDLSKDISRTEAHLGTKAIIDNVIDPVQVGIYFIALRMKRETMDENRGVLDAVLETTQRVTADVDEVVDIGDPYDGYNRCLPAAPFLGPLLAEFGVHVVVARPRQGRPQIRRHRAPCAGGGRGAGESVAGRSRRAAGRSGAGLELCRPGAVQPRICTI